MCPGCIYAIMVVCALVLAGGVALATVGTKTGGKSLWLKMAMYVGVAVSFTAVFYAVCWFAIGVLA